MNVDRLRAAFLEQVRSDAANASAAADRERADRLAEAEREARRVVAEGRAAGAKDAAEEAVRIEAAARREARAHIFAARRALHDELRASALREAGRLRGSKEYAALLDRLVAEARAQLGADAQLEVDAPDLGGVVARRGPRLVDYSVQALTERAVASLGPRVRELWE